MISLILRCFQYEHWINDEQIYLIQRIEKLENENRYLHETYQAYQIQNEKCIQSITNLLIKVLSNHKVNSLLLKHIYCSSFTSLFYSHL